MNAQETRERAANLGAQITEWVYVKGRCYVNVVLRNGKVRTWKVELPDGR